MLERIEVREEAERCAIHSSRHAIAALVATRTASRLKCGRRGRRPIPTDTASSISTHRSMAEPDVLLRQRSGCATC